MSRPRISGSHGGPTAQTQVPAGDEHGWGGVARWMADAFRECAAHAERLGVVVGVQSHGDVLKNAADIIRVLDLIGADWCGDGWKREAVTHVTALTPGVKLRPYEVLSLLGARGRGWRRSEIRG